MAPPRWQNTLMNPGGRLSVGEVDCVIFRHDSMTAQPHEPDINAPVWACDMHDVPYAPKRVWLGDLVGDELEVSGLRGLFART